MKNSRTSITLFTTLSILLVLSAVAAVWAYKQFYEEEKPVEPDTLITLLPVGMDSLNNVKSLDHTRDSLKKVFAGSVKDLENKHAANSTNTGPEKEKFEDFSKLRTEISSILKQKNEDGYELAKQKIGELQKKVNDLTGKNNEIEKENRELYTMLRTYSNERKPVQTEPEIKPIPAVYESRAVAARRTVLNKPEPVQTMLAPDAKGTFEVMNIHLSAITVLDTKDEETVHALRTDKFVGTFSVKNTSPYNSIGEMVVVLMQPDGHVLQKSAWESGTFESPEGKKVYSCKMRFDYYFSEEKQISFSLDAGKCQKGNYSLMIYCKGKLAGKITKTLF